MEALLKVLSEIRPDVDFENETRLIDDGILDSFDIVSLVGRLNEEYDIDISVEELQPENFNSAQAILDLVNKLQG